MDTIEINTETPLVSVVIPCYNHANWIESCIRSVAKSDYPRIELLILDDGSSDASFENAKCALQKYNNIFENVWIEKQENQGITKTANRLIRNSRGKYIVPLASDDELTTGGITSCVRHLEHGMNADSLVMINIEVIDENGDIIRETRIDKYGDKLVGNRLIRDIVLFFGTPYQHQVFPRKAFDDIGCYDENLKYEDLDFVLRFIGIGRVSVIREKVKKYRVWRNGANTPGISLQDIRRIPVYQKNISVQKGLIWLLFYLKIKGEKSHFYNFILRIFAKIHLLSLRITK